MAAVLFLSSKRTADIPNKMPLPCHIDPLQEYHLDGDKFCESYAHTKPAATHPLVGFPQNFPWQDCTDSIHYDRRPHLS